MNGAKAVKFSKRERILCLVTVVAMFFGYSKWVVAKKRASIRAMDINIQTLESSSRDLKTMMAAIQQKRSLASAPVDAAESDALPQYLTNSASLSNLIRQLTNEDPAHKYNVKSIVGRPAAIEKGAESKPYELISYEVKLETSFLSVGHFIERLEESKFVLDVVSVEVQRIESDLKRCTATIRLNSYVPISKDS